jgi:dephospho-CoA kinase
MKSSQVLQKDKLKYAIALTGGIGSGKSTVCSLLSLSGFDIIDTDKISKDILNQNQNKVKLLFGDMYIKNDMIDRKRLSSLIFSDKTAKQKLENFIHPLIYVEVITQAKELEKKQTPYIIDIALYFETKNYDIDTVVCVYCAKDTQLQRATKRDNKTPQEISNILNSQIDIETKKQKSNYIIDNTKDLIHLQNEVEMLKKKIYHDRN